MSKLKLIYFEGCPNSEKAKDLIRDAGFEFDEIIQNKLPDGHPDKKFSSPTIIQGDSIIFGSVAGPGGACSYDSFDSNELKRKLNQNPQSFLTKKSSLTGIGAGGTLSASALIGSCGGACAAGGVSLAGFLSSIGLGFMAVWMEPLRIPLLIVGMVLGIHFLYKLSKLNKPLLLSGGSAVLAGIFVFSLTQNFQSLPCEEGPRTTRMDRLSLESKEVVQSIYELWPTLGRAPNIKELSNYSEKAHNEIEKAYAEFREVGMEGVFYGGSNKIKWLWPFSSEDHGVQVQLEGLKWVNARCAIDALGMSSMYKRVANISAKSALTKKPLIFKVHGESLKIGNPDVIVATGSLKDCDQMLFFSDREEFEKYKAIKSLKDLKGHTLSDGLKFGIWSFKGRLDNPDFS